MQKSHERPHKEADTEVRYSTVNAKGLDDCHMQLHGLANLLQVLACDRRYSIPSEDSVMAALSYLADAVERECERVEQLIHDRKKK